MAQNVYECMVILDSNKYAQNPNGLGQQVPDLVTKLGGEVLVSRLWNEQKLAYPIDGHKKGTYWLTYFRLDSQKLVELTRDLRINETVLRYLTLVVEPRLVEALVEHAKGGAKPKTVDAPPPVEEVEEVPSVEDLAG
ncbi:MAG: 30S ribosomal protein S6 [Pirellulaceae bacterium]|nr:30S ribosomal protein S6 [Pirellulaceae bacterium]